VLHLLIDTSICVDIAIRRDGQRLIKPLRTLVDAGVVNLLVPDLLINEFQRKRATAVQSMVSNAIEHFRLVGDHVTSEGSKDDDERIRTFVFEQRALKLPLIGAMTRKLQEVRELLERGSRLVPTPVEHARVVARGLAHVAPLHRSRNSVADALLIELFSTALESAGPDDTFAFVTSNSDDFSAVNGDRRQPHSDLAELFADPNSTFRHGNAGLEQALFDEIGDYLTQLIKETHAAEQPRGLSGLLTAQKVLSDRSQ
jgi:hypothetical protein